MDEVVSYAKTVLFFLLFVNLLMQFLKGSSYERFVQPICGMMLVILLVRPILTLFGGEEQLLYAAEQKLSQFLVQSETKLYSREEGQSDGYVFAILEQYEKDLTVQLAELLKKEGLILVSANFSIAAEEKEFGTIREITVQAENAAENAKQKIKMEPIVFREETREKTVSAEEIRMRDMLADFYQMDERNIYVSIKEEQDG